MNGRQAKGIVKPFDFGPRPDKARSREGILAWLRAHPGPHSVKEVCIKTRYEYSMTQSRLKTLADQGVITRFPSPKARRGPHPQFWYGIEVGAPSGSAPE